MLHMLGSGFYTIFSDPVVIAIMIFGVLGGIIIGALPGITGVMAIVLLLPLTYYLPPHSGLILLSCIFCGGMMGQSISAILINTPGGPSAAATVLDGYPLCKQGKAGKAIGIATVSSFSGGMFSTICLIFIAPQLAKIALKFQAADFFSLSLFGLTIIASASGKNIVKGVISGFFGLVISTVGIDVLVGSSRYTFGNYYLMGGFQMLPVLIGVFAFAQVFSEVATPPAEVTITQKITGILPTRSDLKGIAFAVAVGCLIGIFIGIIPGTGGGLACWLAYNVMQKISKNRDKYGTGILEGIAAPETANSATTGGCMIPMLCLGVPGDSQTAVMLGGLVMIGVRPGPLLFTESPHIVYALFAGWIVIQFLVLGFGFLSAKFSPAILKLSPRMILPVVAVLCTIGAFSMSNSIFDVFVAVSFGVAGVFMRKYGYPVAPLILGVILGPMAESNLNRAMLNSNNSLAVLFQRPFSLAFLILSVISIAVPLINSYREKRRLAS